MEGEAGYPTREGCTETTLEWQVGAWGHEGKVRKRSFYYVGTTLSSCANCTRVNFMSQSPFLTCVHLFRSISLSSLPVGHTNTEDKCDSRYDRN